MRRPEVMSTAVQILRKVGIVPGLRCHCTKPSPSESVRKSICATLRRSSACMLNQTAEPPGTTGAVTSVEVNVSGEGVCADRGKARSRSSAAAFMGSAKRNLLNCAVISAGLVSSQ